MPEASGMTHTVDRASGVQRCSVPSSGYDNPQSLPGLATSMEQGVKRVASEQGTPASDLSVASYVTLGTLFNLSVLASLSINSHNNMGVL